MECDADQNIETVKELIDHLNDKYQINIWALTFNSKSWWSDFDAENCSEGDQELFPGTGLYWRDWKSWTIDQVYRAYSDGRSPSEDKRKYLKISVNAETQHGRQDEEDEQEEKDVLLPYLKLLLRNR